MNENRQGTGLNFGLFSGLTAGGWRNVAPIAPSFGDEAGCRPLVQVPDHPVSGQNLMVSGPWLHVCHLTCQGSEALNSVRTYP